jgi:hypothetical protein
MWGHVKNIVYAEKSQNINHLKERTEATLDILQHVWTETEYQLDSCHATNEACIEVY